MKFENIRIQRKLMTVILITCATVLLITCSIYYMYERFALRRALVHQMTMLGDIIAANSTAALAFENTEDAREILSSLAVEENIRAACLYDDKGQLFSWYPENAIKQDLPKTIGAKGYEFHNTYISGFQPVFQENRFLGTLYIRSDLKILQEQNRLFGQVVILVIILSFILSYLVSQVSQNVISKPILKLAETAHLISNNKDYSIRAPKLGNDELGRLTDSFNNMLEMIDKQNKVLKENEERTRSVINSSLNAVILMDVNGSITEWSIRAEKMFGWTSEEAIGRELAETIIPHEYRKAHQTGLTNYLKSGEYNLMNKPTEMSALRRNGKIFPIQLSVTEIKNDGESTFCGFITDITEQKRAEEDLKKGKMLLENIVQSMGDAYISLDREWRYTYVNDKALSLMGKSGKDLLGKVLWKVFPDAIGSVFDTEYHKAMMH